MATVKQHVPARRRRAIALIAAASVATPLVVSAANTDNYIGASGSNWNNSNDWEIGSTTTHIIPFPGDTANIIESGITSLFSVTFDDNYTSPGISLLTVDGSTTAGVVLNQTTANNLFSTNETIGNSGIATFNQTAASNVISSTLTLGNNSTAQGIYTLSSTGNLSIFALNVGNSGSGTFNQSGGTLNANNGAIVLGANFGGAGLYQLSGGTISGMSNSGLFVGDISANGTLAGGTGSFIQSGGGITVGELAVGAGTGTNGFYSLSSTGSVTVTNTLQGESVGDEGTGTFIQSGGTNTVSASLLSIGFFASGTGTYTLSAGSVSAPVIHVGDGGRGFFTQSGGTVSMSGTGSGLVVGNLAGSSGNYTLSGGTISDSAANAVLLVGLSGPSANTTATATGSFIQSGGTVAFPQLTLGLNFGSIGLYSLSSNGSLSITGNEILGSSGNGSFVQTGGTNSSNNLYVGSASGAQGSYTLTAGSATIAGAAAVGGNTTAAGGTGNLTISGGSMTISGTLKVWNTPGSFVSLSGGLLSVGGLDLTGTPSLLNWTGGTLNFSAPTTINSNFVLGQSINLPAGMILATSSTLTNNGQITLNSGALGGSGSLVNGTGQINGFGTIGGSGGFTNSAAIIQSGGFINLSNTGANSNSGDIELLLGNQLQLTGGNLANTGTINLNGATIVGPAQLNNNSGGVIAGHGTITAPFANNGTVALTDGTMNLPAFTNNGTVAPNGITANISGGAISNALNIQGFGQINNNITNTATGMIEPLGGRLMLNGTVTNNAGGLVAVPVDNELDVTQGLGTNAGLISLTGGTLNTNNVAMTNSGTISGYGVLRTGGLTNNTQMTLTGGTSTVYGPITNLSGAHINVNFSTAVFNGPVTNNSGATIKTTGANVSFLGAFTNNGTYNSDPSTNYFTDLTVGSGGYLTGGAGDNFFVSGNFTNNSTQTGTWNTSAALLGFEGGVNHQMNVAGSVGQFGWGTLQINSGDSVTVNGNSATAAATVNNGSLSHVSGTSNLGSLSGAGSLSVGNSSGASASVTVSSFNQSSISVNATGSLTVAHNSTPAINNTNGLTIAPGGKLDLTNSTLFIHYTPGADPFSTIVGYLRSGYDNGLWNGSGIVSSTAAANAAQTTAIAVVDSGDGLVAGVPANTIELKYTLYGDTGLTGSVGFNDFTRLTQHYNQTVGGAWDTGDFNYDGSVNFSDFTLMTRTYNTVLGPTAVGAIEPAASSVPEPSLIVLGLTAVPLLRRRRRTLEA